MWVSARGEAQMFYEIVVCPDSAMPPGFEWVRVEVAPDHYVTYFAETYAANVGRRVLCEDGIPVPRRHGDTPRSRAVESEMGVQPIVTLRAREHERRPPSLDALAELAG